MKKESNKMPLFNGMAMSGLLEVKSFEMLNDIFMIDYINAWLKDHHDINILQITQYSMNQRIFTTIWYVRKQRKD